MKSFKYLISFLLLFSAVSCEEHNPFDNVMFDTVPRLLAVDKTELTFDKGNEALTGEIVITSENVAWAITGVPEWLEVAPLQGNSGTTAVKVTAQTLPVGDKRNAVFKLESLVPRYNVAREIKVSQVNPNTNGHDYVDLGLPSGLLWATCNVGANSPEEYGDYFAWGETEPKSSYDSSNSVTYGKSMGDIGGNAQYDAARANWGGSWRLPTIAEFEELLDSDNCTWTWTTQNSVNGYKVTSKHNGNSIFLPAAGYRIGTSLNNDGSYGRYWSSTPYEDTTNRAYNLVFDSDGRRTYWYYRYYGRSVRPVSE